MIATGFTVSSMTRRATHFAGIAFLTLAFGCATEGDAPGGGNYPDQDGATSVPKASPNNDGCEEGATRGCKIVIGIHNGVETCAIGKSHCVEGGWTSCSMDDA